MSDVIIARNIRKSFGEVQAVRDISFDVHSGECFGLLGPNGAGKTTTMSLVRCVSPLDGGQLKVFGRDIRTHARRIRAQLGVVPQHDSLDVDLSVVDNLLVYASYFGIPRRQARVRAEELLHFMALGDKAAVRIDKLSGGLRRRLLIARGLINSPGMLVLDEPTTGLDPQARLHIWQRLRSLKHAGTTMLLCTHYMDEAAQLCDRLAIVDDGRILAEGCPIDLIAEHAGAEVLQIDIATEQQIHDWRTSLAQSLPVAVRIEQHEGTIHCYFPAGEPLPDSLLAEVRSRGWIVTTRPATLEDVFLNLTGRELRE